MCDMVVLVFGTCQARQVLRCSRSLAWPVKDCLVWQYLVFVLQSLQVEIENHETRIMSVVQVGQDLIDEGHPQSEEFRALIEDLLRRWQELKDAVEARSQRLKLSEIAQQVSDGCRFIAEIVWCFSGEWSVSWYLAFLFCCLVDLYCSKVGLWCFWSAWAKYGSEWLILHWDGLLARRKCACGIWCNKKWLTKWF